MFQKFAFALAVLLCTIDVRAHHSFAAEFDADKPFKFTGTVTKVEWTNPHVFFYIDVADEKTGKVTNWAMEMGGVGGLMRAGWTRNSLKLGDKVTVEGSMARDDRPVGNARSVVLVATGQRMFTAQGNQ